MAAWKPSVTGGNHPLPFNSLSPDEFERMCLWLVQREGYQRVEHLGASGSEQGRDIVAWRDGELWAFQCKRVGRFGPTDALKEVAKILDLPKAKRPQVLAFLVSCNISAETRQKTQEHCAEHRIECRFWANTELDARVKRHPGIVEEFFQLGSPPQPLPPMIDVRIDPRLDPLEPELILIPAGEFLMGSDSRLDEDSCIGEQPMHSLYLPDYYLAKTPVTNAEYAVFVGASGHQWPSHWLDETPPQGKEDHPVTHVSWHDALAYGNWLAGATNKPYRLPSEAEWEKAARGTDGHIYPWGDRWDAKGCNSKESGKSDTTPVEAYPQGASSYGLLDMAGNVWEWTISLWGEDWNKPKFSYPYKPNGACENLKAGDEVLRVLRGGAFANRAEFVRCAFRGRGQPSNRDGSIGFRVAASLDY